MSMIQALRLTAAARARFLSSAALLLGLALSTADSARAGAGYNVSDIRLVVVNGIFCGEVAGAWVPGAVKRNQFFFTYQSLKKNLRRKVKNSSGNQQAALKRKLAKIKQLLKKGQVACQQAPILVNPTPTPAPTPAPIPPPPNAVETAWTFRARDLRGQNDAVFSYFCPAGGTAQSVYGVNFYTDDSSVCTAGVHMGLITLGQGGYVTIKIAAGRDLYYGDSRHGVTSSAYGAWPGSFIFINWQTGAQIVKTPLNPASWSTEAGMFYTRIGETFDFTCPADGTFDAIWGTDTYTSDSSICTAAVHAGVITRAGGGAIKILIKPGAASYLGSTRNGVTSSSYGAYGGSFSFVK